MLQIWERLVGQHKQSVAGDRPSDRKHPKSYSTSVWGEQEIQQLWSGESFHRPDERQELSYHLARYAVNSLSQDYQAFVQFVNPANFSDAGESAACKIYDGSPGNLIARFFGEGEWSPGPETWPEAPPDTAVRRAST